MRILWSILSLWLLGPFFMPEVANQPPKEDKLVPTFVYHRFGDNRYPSTNISNDQFESHLKYLSREGFKTLTYSEAISYMDQRSPAAKVVCLTVDDGFKSFLENGVPLLRKYGFKATIFINTETVGSGDYLSWDQLKEIKEAGIEIGNHSHTHEFFLNDTTPNRLIRFADDLMKSQSLIETHLGFRPAVFAYPYGEYDEAMKQVVQEAGFTAAAAQNSGVMYTGMDRYASPRFPMSDRYGKLGSFIEKVGMRPIKGVEVETISKGYNGSPDNPRVIFRFPEANLRLEQVQCFAQGKRCTKSVRIDREGLVQLTVKSQEVLTNRRTLYTVTVPDREGKWHWFSYTWVIPSIE